VVNELRRLPAFSPHVVCMVFMLFSEKATIMTSNNIKLQLLIQRHSVF